MRNVVCIMPLVTALQSCLIEKSLSEYFLERFGIESNYQYNLHFEIWSLFSNIYTADIQRYTKGIQKAKTL